MRNDSSTLLWEGNTIQTRIQKRSSSITGGESEYPTIDPLPTIMTISEQLYKTKFEIEHILQKCTVIYVDEIRICLRGPSSLAQLGIIMTGMLKLID